MSWTNVKLIFLRELKDQLRDRRTLFTIAVLPLLLYPLLAMLVFQMQQFRKESPSRILVTGAEGLPSSLKLLEGNDFSLEFCPPREADLLTIELSGCPTVGTADEQIAGQAISELRTGKQDAVVYFSREFCQRLSEFQSPSKGRYEPSDLDSLPQPKIYLSTASDKSRIAAGRVDAVLARWREAMVAKNLKQNDLPPVTVIPFVLASTDVAEPVRTRAAVWSKILPLVLLVWALTGAFYPAIDLCAGEKERGTLETLLSSPAQRSEIVWGKLLTVMTFSMATSLLNLFSMGATGTFVAHHLQRASSHALPIQFGPPPLAALGWLLIALVPISAMFSALSLAIAAFAKCSKEGQYYLLPLLMVSLPLMILPLLPGAQLELGTAMIPLTGVMLLLKTLIEGQFLEALKYLPFVAGVTAVCCLLAIRWAVHQFNNESVLFRESERFHLGLWVRQMIVQREDAPSVGEALFCGLLLLLIRFFSNFVLPSPASFPQFVRVTLVLQVALVATPACLMAIMLTRKPLGALGLRRPSHWSTLPAAVLLAALLHPLVTWVSYGIQAVYPQNPAVREALAELGASLADAPLWQLVLLIGLTPAICEELAFRGFILNGLRRTGHKWGAILLTSAMFGIVHLLLQQSLNAFLVGIIIGYLAVKSNSLWPAVMFHFTHNSLAVLEGGLAQQSAADGFQFLGWLYISAGDLYAMFPWLRGVLESALPADQLVYHPLALVISLGGSAALLLWLKQLPYHALAEERLQQALDEQMASPAGVAAAPLS